MLYLYGLTKNVASQRLVDYAGEMLSVIVLPGFAAVVSHVSEDEFGKEILLQKIQDISWLQNKAILHEGVIRYVLEKEAILPLKFGTVFENEENLKETLLLQEQFFLHNLEKIQNKHEWDLKLYWDVKQYQNYMNTFPEVQNTGQENGKLTQGKAFFLDKLRKKKIQEIGEKELQKTCQTIWEKLSSLVSEAQMAETQAKKLHQREEEMIFRAFFLIDTQATANFRAEIASMKEEYNTQGIFVEVSGPWAVYHFLETVEQQ